MKHKFFFYFIDPPSEKKEYVFGWVYFVFLKEAEKCQFPLAIHFASLFAALAGYLTRSSVPSFWWIGYWTTVVVINQILMYTNMRNV
jgi:hypothetical protein